MHRASGGRTLPTTHSYNHRAQISPLSIRDRARTTVARALPLAISADTLSKVIDQSAEGGLFPDPLPPPIVNNFTADIASVGV